VEAAPRRAARQRCRPSYRRGWRLLDWQCRAPWSRAAQSRQHGLPVRRRWPPLQHVQQHLSPVRARTSRPFGLVFPRAA
jgi:hypothetical protein